MCFFSSETWRYEVLKITSLLTFCNKTLCRKSRMKITYMTGKTFGNTTDASAKYSYKILASFSSVVFLTKVAWEIITNIGSMCTKYCNGSYKRKHLRTLLMPCPSILVLSVLLYIWTALEIENTVPLRTGISLLVCEREQFSRRLFL